MAIRQLLDEAHQAAFDSNIATASHALGQAGIACADMHYQRSGTALPVCGVSKCHDWSGAPLPAAHLDEMAVVYHDTLEEALLSCVLPFDKAMTSIATQALELTAGHRNFEELSSSGRFAINSAGQVHLSHHSVVPVSQAYTHPYLYSAQPVTPARGERAQIVTLQDAVQSNRARLMLALALALLDADVSEVVVRYAGGNGEGRIESVCIEGHEGAADALQRRTFNAFAEDFVFEGDDWSKASVQKSLSFHQALELALHEHLQAAGHSAWESGRGSEGTLTVHADNRVTLDHLRHDIVQASNEYEWQALELECASSHSMSF